MREKVWIVVETLESAAPELSAFRTRTAAASALGQRTKDNTPNDYTGLSDAAAGEKFLELRADDITLSEFPVNDWSDVLVDADPDDDEPPRCRTEDCDEDPDNGEGWDGYCGTCADRLENAGHWD